MPRSVEESVEDKIKEQLRNLNIEYFTKTQTINSEIEQALKKYPSKKGGVGTNFPDIKLFLTTNEFRKIPVMIEIKGTKGKLAKFKDGEVENTNNKGELFFKNISEYALNGACHYASAILDYTHSYDEVIALGINGYPNGKNISLEYAFYYLNRKNLSVPKKIGDFKDLSVFSNVYLNELINQIDSLNLNEKERLNAIENLENDIESRLNALNQFLHDELLNINPNTRVALLVGMIMAAQGVKDKIKPLKLEELKGEQGTQSNDGRIFLNKISDFLEYKKLPKEKIAIVLNDLEAAFIHSKLWQQSAFTKSQNTDESPLKKTYAIVCDNILPLVKKLQTADIAGKLFNSLTKWLEVPDSEKNDVVLTPRYVVDLMVALTRVNKNSFVWDYATGSGAFLISAMNAMIKDCENIQSPKKKESKIAHIKAFQLLGLEKRTDIYLLGILNMILLDDGSANLLHKDSLQDFDGTYEQGELKGKEFPADVFLLNPPYSAAGKGFIFVQRALKKMSKGRAAVIIQENAGSGNGLPYTKEILEHSTLIASIKMPSDLFVGKSSVQTAIYLFEVGTPHNVKQQVKFIDFSNDGYARAARKKAKASVNLRDVDNAKARYEELINLVVYGNKDLIFYKEHFIEDRINLEGRDWTFAQHKVIDTKPTLKDFKKCVGDYLAWEVSNVLKKEKHSGELSSPRLEKLEKDFKQSGGEWREYKIGDLFEVKSSKKIFHANNLKISPNEDMGFYPYVVRSTLNNGIRGYINESAKFLNPANTLSFAQDTFSVFYQEKPYFTGNKVKILVPKFEIFNRIIALFFVSIYQKVLADFTWGIGSTENSIKEILISLPTHANGQIAFDFMEKYIQELEIERVEEIEQEKIQELEAYLQVSGLKDYALNDKEKEALEEFKTLKNKNIFRGGGLRIFKVA